jgi:hypothetical protein
MAEVLSIGWVASHPRFRNAFTGDGFVKLGLLVAQGRSRSLVRSASEALPPLRSHPAFDVMEHVSKNASIALVRHREAWQGLCEAANARYSLHEDAPEGHKQPSFASGGHIEKDWTAR